LRHDDERARRIAHAGTAWALRELSGDAMHCYWATVIDALAELEVQGGALNASGQNSRPLGLNLQQAPASTKAMRRGTHQILTPRTVSPEAKSLV
jgi:hypothetical protein